MSARVCECECVRSLSLKVGEEEGVDGKSRR